MITVKEYAEKNKVNIQTVYTRMRTHAAELEGHVFEIKGANGRPARCLDDKAVEIITKKPSRSKKQMQEAGQEADLRQENQKLQAKIEELRSQLSKEISSVIALQDEKTKLLKMLQENQPEKVSVVFSENYEILKSQAERKGVSESEIVNDLIVYFLDMPPQMRKSVKSVFEQLMEIEKKAADSPDSFWAQEQKKHIKAYQNLINLLSM